MAAEPLVALVAEDHPGYREKVAGLLAGWGLRVHAAEDGRAAIKLLRGAERVDLLVTDLEMPYANGFEVIEAWLALGRPLAAVVMLTGIADHPAVQTRCATIGVRLLHKLAMDLHFEGTVRTALASIAAAERPAS